MEDVLYGGRFLLNKFSCIILIFLVGLTLQLQIMFLYKWRDIVIFLKMDIKHQ